MLLTNLFYYAHTEADLLFLLNDRILKLVDGVTLLERSGLPKSFATQCSLNDAIIAMQTAFIEDPNFAKNSEIKASALAWLISSRSQANAAMFVPTGAKIKHPHQVAFRLGTVGITVLGTLNAMQDQGRLNANIVNESVWAKVAA